MSKPSNKRLARYCGWERKRVPRAWKELGPGAQYGTEKCTKMAGRKVKVRGSTWEVKGCGTPVKPSSQQMKRRSRRYLCQGSILLGDAKNPQLALAAVPRSIVRAALRREEHPRRLCEHQATLYQTASEADLRHVEREAAAAGLHPWELIGDYEFPHAPGAGPCCPLADTAVREGLDLDEAWSALVARVRSRRAKAAMSDARVTARRRARVIREGGDEGDANYRETLRGHERAMTKRFGAAPRGHRAA